MGHPTDALTIATLAVQRYAETHPRPSHVTKAQAAEMLEISAPTLNKLIRSGALSLNAAGRIPVGQIDAVLVGRAQKAA